MAVPAASAGLLHWNVADSEAKEDSETGANKQLGKVVAAAGDNDATVRVRLSQ
jgi:predicted RecA/RadA family phage recombinase